MNVEQVQQKEVAIAVTTKNSTCKGDQESIEGEANTNNDANLLHQQQDLRGTFNRYQKITSVYRFPIGISVSTARFPLFIRS